jgi:dolichol-phosphate mannosyltransferase
MTREAARIDANIVEYPITFVERSFGKSKMSPEIVREAILKVSQWGIRRLFP